MNAARRRLFRAFLEGGVDLPDGERAEGFAALVRDGLMLLTPTLRRAVELALESDEEAPYDALAAALSQREGRPVTVDTVRQRVSRGVRRIERWMREELEVSRHDGAQPPVAATAGR